MTTRKTSERSRLVMGFAFVAVAAFALWKSCYDDTPPLPETLNVYCFTGMERAMRDQVLPAFVAAREAATGNRVELITAYAGSGTITERIIKEFPAGVAILASEVDADRLLQRGVVGVSWKRLPRGGILARSPLVLATREGNPRGISSYADLARPDLSVVLADPLTSGLGEWTLLAVHGPESAPDGEQRMAAMRRNATARERSAQAAVRRFVDGTGDVTVGYESQLAGLEHVEIVYPEPTFVAEHVVVRIDRNVGAAQRELADAFVEFLWSDEAQQALAEAGLRSVDEARNAGMRPISSSATLAELGGTAAARRLLQRHAAPN